MKLYFGIVVLVFISNRSFVWGDELVYPCLSTPDCAPIQDAVCSVDNVCVCPGGQILNSAMTRCLTVSGGYNSMCDETIQCSVRMLTGATCFYDANVDLSKCRCEQGYHYLHGRCWESVGLNEACTSSDQCYGNSNYESLSCGSAGVCVCSDGFYLHADQTYCRREGTEPGDDCYFDFDCKFDDAFCNLAKQCELRTKDVLFEEDLHLATNEFTGEFSKDLNQPWSQHDAYIPNTSCDDNGDCTDPNSECTPGKKCWCKPGYYYYGGTRCAKELGEPCSILTECNHITNGTCRTSNDGMNGMCACNAYSTPDPGNQKCNRLRPEIEFGCQSQQETCQNFGPECECVPSGDFVLCLCSSDSHFESETQTCWLTKGFGESCLDERDCVTASGPDGVSCIDGSCQCIESYHETTADCRPDGLAYGDACIDDVDCFFDNAKCVDKMCICNIGYYSINNTFGEIECMTGIGGTCNSTADCEHIEEAVCNNATEKCACDSQQSEMLVSSEIYDKCLKVATNYEEECVEDLQCQTLFGDDIFCIDEVCMCRDKYHFRDSACWPITLLSEKCNRTSQCYVPSDSERTECRNGVCECKYEYPTNPEKTDCTSGGNVVHQNTAALTSIVFVTYTLIASTFQHL